MTYVLGTASRAHLDGVHPKLVAVVERAIQITAQDFTVHEGLRTLAQQKLNVAKGVSRTLASKHIPQPDGYGHAVDLVPWVDGKPQWLWGEPKDKVGGCYAIAAAMRQAAAELKTDIRWGGAWDRPLLALSGVPAGLRDAVAAYKIRHVGSDLLDGVHFELRSA
jgi:peptidoglycan L-alanyl-D-glutamate endopeptidase CwlK